MPQPERQTVKPDLTSLPKAAKELGVPVNSLRTAATEHGFLIRMGRAVRIDRNDYGSLVKKCRDQARAQGSTNSSTARTGTSGTPASRTDQRAAQAAQKLKKRSRHTSQPEGAKVLPMSRET